MKRVLSLSALALAAVACSAAVDKPGATLHGPGALAVVDAIVDHGSGSQRPYLAIANQRGDELRLIDTTDNDVVTSPGLVFPLSIPTAGRPMFLAAADLCDSALATELTADECSGALPDALVVIAAGSNVIEVVDTWSGYPSVVTYDSPELPVAVPEDAEVLSIAAVRVPGSTIGKVKTNVGRILIGLTGDRLAVVDFTRTAAADDAPGKIDRPSVVVLKGLGFNPISLSQGADPRYVYSASLTPVPDVEDEIPLVAEVDGIAEIAIPAVPVDGSTPTHRALDALVPTVAVAAARFGATDRVIAVPVGGECGDGKPLPCGLLAIDPVSPWESGRRNLAANFEKDGSPVDLVPYLQPLPVPGFVAGLVAVGRSVGTLLLYSAGAPVETRGIVVVSSTDGGVYLADVDRWALVGATHPLWGDGMTRVSAATAVAGTASRIGLWPLYVAGASAKPSAADAELARRIRVTPGFTPDDAWTLSYQGILPDLDARDAQVSWDSATQTLTVTVPGMSLASREVQIDDLVAISVGPVAGDAAKILRFKGCIGDRELAVTALTDVEAPALALPICPDSVELPFSEGDPFTISTVPSFTAPAVVTFRAGELVLVGSARGYAGRPPPTADAPASAAVEFPVLGTRLFYVTDDCPPASTCATTWIDPPYGLEFPFPDGPALGLTPGYVDAGGNATETMPSRGTAIAFTTKSGVVVPTARRPIDDGTALSSALPTGLAFLPPAAGAGVTFYASYTAGLIMNFSTGSPPSSMAIIR